jgi:hypothetical protein
MTNKKLLDFLKLHKQTAILALIQLHDISQMDEVDETVIRRSVLEGRPWVGQEIVSQYPMSNDDVDINLAQIFAGEVN